MQCSVPQTRNSSRTLAVLRKRPDEDPGFVKPASLVAARGSPPPKTDPPKTPLHSADAGYSNKHDTTLAPQSFEFRARGEWG